MFCVTEGAEVYLHMEAADMRLGIDRLAEKIRAELKRTPLSGGIYVFLSRSRKKIRILYWDNDGYAMWLKRLEAGIFKVELKNGYEQITGVDLKELLAGLDFSRINLRKKVEKGLLT